MFLHPFADAPPCRTVVFADARVPPSHTYMAPAPPPPPPHYPATLPARPIPPPPPPPPPSRSLHPPPPACVRADHAFLKLLKALQLTKEELLAKKDLLNAVLSYHVIGARITKQDLKEVEKEPQVGLQAGTAAAATAAGWRQQRRQQRRRRGGWKPRREKGGRRVNRSMGDFGHTGAPGRAALPNTFAHLSSFRLPVCINHAS